MNRTVTAVFGLILLLAAIALPFLGLEKSKGDLANDYFLLARAPATKEQVARQLETQKRLRTSSSKS